MRASRGYSAVIAACAFMMLQACAGSGSAPQAGPSPNTADAAQLAELEALYRAREDSARMHFTPADVDFMSGMIAHHAQALVMSSLAPSNEASPSIRTLTARIINAQNDEISTMQGWLEDRGQPVPQVHIMGNELMIMGPNGDMPHMHEMVGMLSDEQMANLEAARGVEFDRLFLTYMIQHHAGAVTMVHELFATDGAALDDTVFKIASDIQVDQTTEINRMELMLEALPDPGARP